MIVYSVSIAGCVVTESTVTNREQAISTMPSISIIAYIVLHAWHGVDPLE